MTAFMHEIGHRPRGRAALLLVLAAASFAALVWLVTHLPQRGWEREVLDVSLSGEHYRLEPLELARLERFSLLYFADGEEAARALAAEEISARLDEAFGAVEARLPVFADWYYSLSGEYTRLAMMALFWLELTEGDYTARRAAKMLFPEQIWESDLTRLELETARRLQAHHAEVREGWLAELTERLSVHRVPPPLPAADGDGSSRAEGMQLDGALEGLMARERMALQARASVSTVAAGGAVVGPALWRAAARQRGVQAGRAVARGAGRGAARAGSAAAGGAAVCSPAGPLAAGCAVLAGAATWIAADWLLLRIDEHANREEMIAALQTSLAALRDDMERELLAAYEELISAYYGGVRSDIEDTFVPARARGAR